MAYGGQVSFFEVPEPDPEPEEHEHVPPVWAEPPHGVLPSVSTQRAVLANTEDVLVAADRFLVYPNGVVFTLTMMRREEPDERDHHPPWEMFGRRRSKELPDEMIRLGILFSDGSKWTNVTDRHPFGEEDVEGPVVMGRGGGGGGRVWEMGYWVWPLPPPGPLTFVVSWPAEGVAEHRVQVDADEFIELAPGAERVWPEAK